ncbi:MAG: xanthine dehydrogenase family protein molybdopterin-binding subunit [Verrucomicrobia bacterium]|nr:xanthine dehydrogenase family protein molybdopterin-binding subunit [Verrucomicrobiota bacterium]
MSAEPKPLEARAVGQPLTRVDGLRKVTGTATYVREFQAPGRLHAVLMTSAVAKGRITKFDAGAAERLPGVRAVFSHLNGFEWKADPKPGQDGGIRIEERLPLSDAVISYGGQIVGLVVAETLEVAREAAGLVRIAYTSETPTLVAADAPDTATKPAKNNGQPLQFSKGDGEAARADRNLRQFEGTYTTPTETHHPMECSATTAWWVKADRLVVYDTTQFVKGVQNILALAFGLPRENVRVICPYVGGAFGCKGPVWPHTLLAAAAAQRLGRPVSLELSRAQMASCTGHRSPTVQRVAFSAKTDGQLQAIRHLTESLRSPVGTFVEACGFGGAKVLYQAPAIEFGHTLHTVNVAPPSFMRAPGEAPGTFAMECAIDELAVQLGQDPITLRLANDPLQHPTEDKPFSTKNLSRCYRRGAERFGWSSRTPEPGSMTQGRLLRGLGVATATYPANRWNATARLELRADGTLRVQCAAHDLGTGAYTVLTQIAADALGLAPAQVQVELGCSDHPFGPVAGGSNTTATVGSAIVRAAEALVAKFAALAVRDERSPLSGRKPEEVTLVAPLRIGVTGPPGASENLVVILLRHGLSNLAADGVQERSSGGQHAFQSFGAHFCEVLIDPAAPRVQVRRVLSVIDGGRIVNPRTARSQILGGVVMGLGMALMEETIYDPATGLPVTRNLADYHVPVNADVPEIEVLFEGEPDLAFNPVGARGLGEIGTTGIAAAVANAVYHASGRRVRELPLTLDKLL